MATRTGAPACARATSTDPVRSLRRNDPASRDLRSAPGPWPRGAPVMLDLPGDEHRGGRNDPESMRGEDAGAPPGRQPEVVGVDDQPAGHVTCRAPGGNRGARLP